MKKNLLVLITITSLVIITSCGDDEPTVNPLVGKWVLDDVTASDLPSGYAFATNPEASSTSWFEDEYVIEFFADGTYERELSNTTSGDLEDTGEWELDGDDIDLDQDEFDTEDVVTSFTISGEITDRSMTLVGTDGWFVWPPAIVDNPDNPLDTVTTQESLNALFFEYGEVVDVTVTMEFDRD